MLILKFKMFWKTRFRIDFVGGVGKECYIEFGSNSTWRNINDRNYEGLRIKFIKRMLRF